MAQRIVHVLVGIDGTHDQLNDEMKPAEYDKSFGGSHVRRITKHSRFPDTTIYVRGPAGNGRGITKGLELAVAHIAKHAEAHPGDAISLHFVGFSRGAAMVLDLANKLLILDDRDDQADLARSMMYGTRLKISRLRKTLKGRFAVHSLIMFDAVDMSFSLDCDPPSPLIGHSVLIRRSAWKSRQNWTNVGDVPAAGTPANHPRERYPIVGTHGAMGGIPRNGDIPIPLVNELLREVTSNDDWGRIEDNWAARPLENHFVSTVLGNPGDYVNYQNGKMMGPAAILAMQLKLKATFLTEINGRPNQVFDTMGHPVGRLLYPFRDRLRSYVSAPILYKGLGVTSENESLGGFPAIDICFRDLPGCLAIINRYRIEDDKGARDGLAQVKKSLGRTYPATA